MPQEQQNAALLVCENVKQQVLHALHPFTLPMST